MPAEVEGSDLSFILRGGSGEKPAAVFLQGLGHTYRWIEGFEWRAVRDARFTYAKYLRDGRELLFDRGKDPLMKRDLFADSAYKNELDRLKRMMAARMEDLHDEFRTCTWYRDHWMFENYSVRAAARGEFGPLPPIEPKRI